MLKQIIPTKICLLCDVCCRFLDKAAGLVPLFLPHEITPKIKSYLDKRDKIKLKPCLNIYACSFFNPKTNKCSIYSRRPLDCQLYPFTIMFNENRERIILGIDKKCPFAANPENENHIKDYFHYLAELLEKKENALLIAKNPLFIGNFQEDVIKFSHLDTLTKILINNPEKNGFKKLSLKDKPFFDRYFKKFENRDSSQSFVNLYIWKEINPVWWKKKEKGLDILLETESGYIGFDSLKKFPDYIYLTKDLAELKGNRYKHKRAISNYFSKHYRFKYLPYKQTMKDDCLKLFSKWASERKKKFQDLYYHKLLEDSYSAQKVAIENYKALKLIGRVIKIKNKICAYTFGYDLTPSPFPLPKGERTTQATSPLPFGERVRVRGNMFCVLLEICDLKFKGISEFIFREFCRELTDYKYINTMDDSGLENMRISKASYHPII